SRTQTALILASWRSTRPMTSCASSTAETFPAFRAADSSVAVAKLHCDFAKAFLLLSAFASDDAAFRCRLQEPAVRIRSGLSWQHPLHDAVAVDKDVGKRGRDMNADHRKQAPFHRLMQTVDRLAGCRIVSSQHRQRHHEKQ